MTKSPLPKPQLDKFKDLARELETNEDEAAFAVALRKIAKSSDKSEAKPKDGISKRETD